MRSLPSFVMLIGLVACSDDESPPPTTCATDEDCATNEYCRASDNTCREPDGVSTTLDDVTALCSMKPLDLFTEPGRVTAAMPKVTRGILPDGSELTQSPAEGTRLSQGDSSVVIARADTGDVLCTRPVKVVLDPNSAAIPSFSYQAAGVNGVAQLGAQPALVLGNLLDELGQPIEMALFVDGQPFQSLAMAQEMFFLPGIHITQLAFTDFYGRTLQFHFSEWWQVALSTVFDNSQVSIGVKDGCNCRLVRQSGPKSDCMPPTPNEGDGEESYQCVDRELRTFASEVTDRWGEPDTQSSNNSGQRTDNWSIQCATEAGAASCESCCPMPVIIASVSAQIGGLRVYAEDGTERAVFTVKLEGSGLGRYSVAAGAASGFQSYMLEQGIEIGVEGGLGATEEGGEATAGLSASRSMTTTYAGMSSGWQSAQPVARTNLTGWKTSCSSDHTLNVSFQADLLADVDDWEQFFGITSDDAKARLDSHAYLDYTNVYFRCDGVVPMIGGL